MAHETVTQSSRFYCVSLTPDICKTPIGNSTPPIPYNIIGEFKQAVSVSPNVKAQSEPVILHKKSFIPTVKGDAPGTAGGIKSGTVGKKVETKEASSTKGSNATKTVQESRMVWMNSLNTYGRILERQVQAARDRIKKLSDDADKSLKEGAQKVKDDAVPAMREFGQDAMDAGGKVAIGSAAVGGAGLVAGATVVGLPAAGVLEVTAAAGGTVAAVVTSAGAVATTAAGVADMGADLILTGAVPDVGPRFAGMVKDVVQGSILKKIPGSQSYVKWVEKKLTPGKKPKHEQKKHKQEEKKDATDGKNGGKTKDDKGKKNKPSDCCPKDAAAGKKTRSKYPVHFGTGEEILYQTDFVLDGSTPIIWSRCYRSGSECEDWGVLGARWSMPFTASLSVCKSGIVYHEDTGRALRLPALTVGATHDHRSEGFILSRDSDTQFTITTRDGNTDIFLRGPDGWLPHGYNGANAMLAPRAALLTERFYLARSVARDGKSITIERHHDAKPGAVLLRVRTDDGQVIEAMREDAPQAKTTRQTNLDPVVIAPRIGRVEEVRADGSRLCHVSYRYEPEPGLGSAQQATPAKQKAFAALPQRYNLVAQTDIIGQSRTYAYHHHLLVHYTTYAGFAHGLQWVSLASLRERWAGSALDNAALDVRHPIALTNSYQARAIRTTTADGIDEVQIEYVDNDTTRVTEADGGVLEFTFNSNWLATNVRRVPSDGGSPRSLGRREWDRDGMLTADIDAEGNASRYTYDTVGNLTTITDARRHVTRIEYDGRNQPIAVTDALGHTTRRSYDASGKIVESTDALGRTTGYRYDAQGRLSVLTDARGGTKQLSYDNAGRLVAYTDCSSFTNRYAYDDRGRLTGSADAIGNVSRYAYDALGRLIAVSHPDRTEENYAYDAEGNLVAHTGAKGQLTRYRYNGHGVPIERIDAKGQTLQYRYDKALRLIELINGNGESYHFGYDAESRLISETGFDGKTTTYTYDSAGQLIASDCNGVHADFMRDSLGLLQAKNTPDGSVRYAYDALGRLTAVATMLTTSQAEQHFTYDPVGQLTEERSAYFQTPPDLPDEPKVRIASFALTHAYDVLGNRLQTTLPNGRTVDTQRYGSGHWHGTLWQGISVVDLERDHLHRETARQIGTGQERLNATRAYDPQSRLLAITLHKGLQQLRERRYAYDATGNLMQIADAQRGSTNYRYDPLGQLLSAVQPNLHETFAFDPAGNLLDAAKIAANDTSATPPNLNELTEQPSPGSTLPPKLAKVTHNLLQQYLGTTYDYDVQGNTVRKCLRIMDGANEAAALEFAYDTDNRLITATRIWNNARQVAQYTYDAFGRRIAKQVTEDLWAEGQATDTTPQEHTSRTTLFVWDGDVLVQEIHPDKTVTYLYEPESFVPLARIESAEGQAAYGSDVVHLLHVAHWELPTDKDEPAEHLQAWRAHDEAAKEQQHQDFWRQRQQNAQERAGSDRIHYYHCDHLGTPLELTDKEGKVVWAARYKAWGRILRYDAKEVEQPIRFQGQYEDSETGLHYNRYRFYDPDAGRFVTQDPIGLFGGANLYQYAPNPVRWTDPLGLFAQANYTYGIGRRIESATATITPADLGTGSATNATSRAWARKLGCSKDDAGHVIGNQLGGSGGKKHVFPQTLGINRGAFAQFESAIANQVRAGNIAQIRVDLMYQGVSTRPTEIVYSATINGQTQTRRFANPKNCP